MEKIEKKQKEVRKEEIKIEKKEDKKQTEDKDITVKKDSTEKTSYKEQKKVIKKVGKPVKLSKKPEKITNKTTEKKQEKARIHKKRKRLENLLSIVPDTRIEARILAGRLIKRIREKYKTGEYDSCIVYCERGNEIYESAEFYYYKAKSLYEKGEIDGAEIAIELAKVNEKRFSIRDQDIIRESVRIKKGVKDIYPTTKNRIKYKEEKGLLNEY